MVLTACDREDFDTSGTVWEEPPAPGLIQDTSVNKASIFKVRTENNLVGREIVMDGFFLNSELSDTDSIFMEIIVPVNNTSGTNPFLMGWFHPALETGMGIGATAYFILLDEDGNEYGLSCEPLLGGEYYFDVYVEELSEFLEPVKGRFEGRGYSEKDGGFVDFSGEFNVPLKFNSCGDEIVINQQLHEVIKGGPITITDADINAGCLQFEFTRSGGCEDLMTSVYDSGVIENTDPPQRYLRLVDRSEDACESLVSEKEGFSLELLKIPGKDHIILNIEGWGEPIDFYY